jgi:hypothetical protein
MLTAKEFLMNRDETGRMIVKSIRTGKTYYVETIDDKTQERQDWGSIDPATGDLTVKKGWQKFKGSINDKESLITKENGFDVIHTLKAGQSPASYINELDEKYPTIKT